MIGAGSTAPSETKRFRAEITRRRTDGAKKFVAPKNDLTFVLFSCRRFLHRRPATPPI